MRGMRSAEVQILAPADALPGDVSALFATADSFFAAEAWWRTVLAHATPKRAEPCFVVCRVKGAAVGLFPMLHQRGWRGFTTPYTCLYTPLIAPGADAAAVGEIFGRFCRGRGVVRLDAMPAEWPQLEGLATGLRKAGLQLRRFDHFGNWFGSVAGLDWTGYLAARPGALRETILRRLRRAERLPDAALTIVDGEDGLDAGIAAFEAVYRKSWKQAEPFPTFNAASIRTAAALGLLRLGIWSIANEPVAVQFWIQERGRATVLKLAHDEAFKAHSPGTVLTALMIRHLLARETLLEIDFGRGDDPYKRDWAGSRRQRIGILIVAPWRPSGLAALLRHEAGRLRRRWRSIEVA